MAAARVVRVALLQLAAGGDDRLQPGPEIAPVGRAGHRDGVEGCGDRLQWRGRTGAPWAAGKAMQSTSAPRVGSSPSQAECPYQDRSAT
jgi:hypothetical protein